MTMRTSLDAPPDSDLLTGACASGGELYLFSTHSRASRIGYQCIVNHGQRRFVCSSALFSFHLSFPRGGARDG